ncbi:MAG: GTP cyclohydrolase FolE2 [Sutterellaceae bacterium]|nr:GTP cyclohydrolase FolE2 [Sutterellaceae bacterium]
MDQNSCTTCLPDVQNLADGRNIAIDRVGVRGLTVPMTVASVNGPQPTVAEVCMCVSLPADKKGTHMSRFISLLADNHESLSANMMKELLAKMLVLLEAHDGYIEIRCPFFVTKASPVSKLKSLMNYKVRYIAEKKNGVTSVIQEITAPVTSLCPCSKEISDYGAHNQRSAITIAAEIEGELSLEEQIRIAETSASCELWSRLKRNDEKYVTEYAYDHPKFVEDIVRDTAKQLNDESRVVAYRVEAENFESIHNHSAYAQIERDKRKN